MPTEVDRNRRFRRTMSIILVVVLALCTLSVVRTGQVQGRNEATIVRLEAAEREINDLVALSKLDCPNRAMARHIIRTAILADPDVSPEIVTLVNTDFPEIVCTP